MTSYKLAAIDVYKKMLAVVVADVAQEEWELERRKFGTAASELRVLEEWLATRGVREAVMESTAQYGKPVWQQLEGRYRLQLAQAHSNRAARGRKRDFRRCRAPVTTPRGGRVAGEGAHRIQRGRRHRRHPAMGCQAGCDVRQYVTAVPRSP